MKKCFLLLCVGFVMAFIPNSFVHAHELPAAAATAGGQNVLFVLSTNDKQSQDDIAEYLEQYGTVKFKLRPHYIVAKINPSIIDQINDPRIIAVHTGHSLKKSDLLESDAGTDFVTFLWNKDQQASAGDTDIFDTIHVDDVPDNIASAPVRASSVPVGAGSPLTSIPVLHSFPSATAKLYIDFDGEPASTWGSYSVPTSPAYDTDGDATTFSSTELANIAQIWARVSEKYSMFNIDVTTVDPGYSATDANNNKKYQKIVVSGDGSWFGGGGGVCYVGSFANSSPNTCYVFPANLGNGDPHYTAEAVSHESGHSFGLQHQSTYSGTTKTNEYNPGDGARAPVMGNSYSAARGLWWVGSSTISSGSLQSDLPIISSATNNFGYKADDAGDTTGTAAALTLASGTTISGSGIIASSTDTDYYSFSAGAGSATFVAAATSSGPILDLSIELHNSSDVTIATASSTSFGETLNTTIPSAGTYYLVIKSAGGYSDIGEYFLSGTIPSATADVTAPIISSISSGTPTISGATITWTTNEAADTQLNYGLTSTYTASSTLDSTKTTSHSVTLSGLTPNTTYHYRVRSTDASGNLAVSSDQTFTTAADTTAPTVSMTAPTTGSTVAGTTVAVSATASDAVGVVGVQFKLDGALLGTEDTGAPYSIIWDSTTASDGSHSIIAVARDAAGNRATSTAVSVTVDNTGPVRSAGAPTGTLAHTTTSTTLSLTTDEASTCKYSTSSGIAFNSMTAFATTGGTSHSSSISVSSGNSYTYYVKCQDASLNVNASDYIISFSVANAYSIGAWSTTGGTISPGTTTIASGGNQTFTITPDVHYKLTDLTVDGVSDATSTSAATSYTFTNVTANHTIAATFTADAYTLSITASNGSVTKSPDQVSYSYNTNVSLTATPNSGYSFTGWVGDASGSTSPATVTMTRDMAVTALFLPNNAPLVDAGSDQTITLPSTATLTGSTTDDGLPYNTFTWSWTKVSGSGTVTFGNASATSTTATFSAADTYVLALVANDGAERATSTVTITVNAAVTSGGGGGGGGGGSSGGGGYTTPTPIQPLSTSTTAILTNAGTSTIRYTTLLTKTLVFGITSQDVMTLQKFLKSQGTDVFTYPKFTTYYGTYTRDAVKRFQKAQGLVETGTVDVVTLARINQIAGPQAVFVPAMLTTASTVLPALDLKTGMTHPNVKILQQFLNRNGFTVSLKGAGSPGLETTYFGPATTRAVMLFQRAYSIYPVAGYVGPLTRAKINALVNLNQ